MAVENVGMKQRATKHAGREGVSHSFIGMDDLQFCQAGCHCCRATADATDCLLAYCDHGSIGATLLEGSGTRTATISNLTTNAEASHATSLSFTKRYLRHSLRVTRVLLLSIMTLCLVGWIVVSSCPVPDVQITYAWCSGTQAEAQFGKRIVVDDTAAAGPPSVAAVAALPLVVASSSVCTVFAAVAAVAVVEQVWLAGSASLVGH